MAEKEYIERGEAKRVMETTDWLNPAIPYLANVILDRLPAADVVEVVHGEWIEGAEHFTNGFYEAECSVCGNYIRWNEGNSGEWNFCPNCGAKMDGGFC